MLVLYYGCITFGRGGAERTLSSRDLVFGKIYCRFCLLVNVETNKSLFMAVTLKC